MEQSNNTKESSEQVQKTESAEREVSCTLRTCLLCSSKSSSPYSTWEEVVQICLEVLSHSKKTEVDADAVHFFSKQKEITPFIRSHWKSLVSPSIDSDGWETEVAKVLDTDNFKILFQDLCAHTKDKTKPQKAVKQEVTPSEEFLYMGLSMADRVKNSRRKPPKQVYTAEAPAKKRKVEGTSPPARKSKTKSQPSEEPNAEPSLRVDQEAQPPKAKVEAPSSEESEGTPPRQTTKRSRSKKEKEEGAEKTKKSKDGKKKSKKKGGDGSSRSKSKSSKKPAPQAEKEAVKEEPEEEKDTKPEEEKDAKPEEEKDAKPEDEKNAKPILRSLVSEPKIEVPEDTFTPKIIKKELLAKQTREKLTLEEASVFLTGGFARRSRRATFSSMFAGLDPEEELEMALRESARIAKEDLERKAVEEVIKMEVLRETKLEEGRAALRKEMEREAELVSTISPTDWIARGFVDQELQSLVTVTINAKSIFNRKLRNVARAKVARKLECKRDEEAARIFASQEEPIFQRKTRRKNK